MMCLRIVFSHKGTSPENETDEDLGHTTTTYLWLPAQLYQEFLSALKYVNLQFIYFS